MRKADQTRLVKAALRARLMAAAPYSKFQVGAALLTAKGEIIGGANVESASYGLTCCAERIAIFKAVTEGHTQFTAIAVVADAGGTLSPCGACRQLLSEYAPNAVVWLADVKNPKIVREFKVHDLLPHAFRL
jgi:cytidine deaminase